MTLRSPGLLAGLTIPIVFGLLFLVVVLQGLIDSSAARFLLFGVAFLAARWLARARGVNVGRLGFVRPSLPVIGLGFVLGAGLVTVVVAIMVAAGWYSLEWSGAWGSYLTAMLNGAAVGLYEEALFRSIWFGGLEPLLGTWPTLAVSAVLFGFLHSFNPGATVVSSVAIALTAGVLLGAVFVVLRDVWLVATIHGAWNATLGGLFGMPVSGSRPREALFTAVESGPDLWTGGSFGPEASLIAVLVVGGVGIWFVWRGRRSGSVVALMWRHRRED